MSIPGIKTKQEIVFCCHFWIVLKSRIEGSRPLMDDTHMIQDHILALKVFQSYTF